MRILIYHDQLTSSYLGIDIGYFVSSSTTWLNGKPLLSSNCLGIFLFDDFLPTAISRDKCSTYLI